MNLNSKAPLNELLKQLEAQYIEDPTTQPTAFWKFKDWATNNQLSLREKSGVYSFVLGETLLCRYPYDWGYDAEVDDGLTDLVFLNPQPELKTWHETKYFKLFVTHEGGRLAELPAGFAFKLVEEHEYEEVAMFINDNYEHIRVTSQQVLAWIERKVHDHQLWVWIIDSSSEKKAALGIAEIDLDLKEGALEWIQVDPGYRGKGLGKVLVHELLHRLSQQATFTTVSGEVDNKTEPERLYRACGFQGDAVWHVYRKPKG